MQATITSHKVTTQELLQRLRPDTKFRNVGANLFCLSPLRTETTDSFCIFPDNRWTDYGTGETGDVVDLYMKLKNCDYATAVEQLASF